MPQKRTANRAQSVVIRRVSPVGLTVTLDDGREGLIRAADLALDSQTQQDWRERYRPGDTINAVITRTAKGRIDLSVRLAESDPWLDVEEHFPVGHLAEGVVTGIMPYGAFVELQPGIAGLVHMSRFPSWIEQKPGDILWPGDLVKVLIKDIDVSRRRMTLDMRELARYRWQRETDEFHETSTRPRPEETAGSSGQLSLDQLLAQNPKQILVVEDDDMQRDAMTRWLHFAGQRAHAVATAEDALELIDQMHPDLVLMDVGLPKMNGIEAAFRSHTAWPNLPIVLMTDWGRAERYASELDELAQVGISLMIKPLLPQDLLQVLTRSSEKSVSAPVHESPFRARIDQTSLKPDQTLQGELTDVLARLKRATRADLVVLFQIDPRSEQVSVIEQLGSLALRMAAMPELMYSPVRDAAEDGQIVRGEGPEQVKSPRFRHLTSALDFAACLGVPVPATLLTHFALFAFYGRPTAINDIMLAHAEAASAAVGAWLERRQFTQQAADLHRIGQLGQLSRALVHEVSGRLTPISLALAELRASCDTVEQSAVEVPAQAIAEAKRARRIIEGLAQQTGALAKTTRSFGRIMRAGQEELLRPDDLIDEAVEILHDPAELAHVAVKVLPPPRLYFTRAQVTHFQQVIVNVLLNAIQQIELVRPKQGGRVEIRLTQSTLSGQNVLQVQVEDDGPGIHRRLWDKIFSMDYTSRPQGSGLGLYISRRLIESQGGRVYVASSHILWGSTFVIELPIRL